MAKKAIRQCLHPYCSEVVRYPEKYCHKHKTQINKQEYIRRGRLKVKQYASDWQIIRRAKLRRNPVCEWRGCEKLATEVDHIVPLNSGGNNSFSNLQSLCAYHHRLKTIKYDGGFGREKKEFRKEGDTKNA